MTQRQVVTIAINCDKSCPEDKPECCLDCKNMKKAREDKIELVEVLHDTRDEQDETPPQVTKTGEVVEND